VVLMALSVLVALAAMSCARTGTLPYGRIAGLLVVAGGTCLLEQAAVRRHGDRRRRPDRELRGSGSAAVRTFADGAA
jgi:hypothetical protein